MADQERGCLLKICGLTRGEDVAAAVAAGADYLGFIMARSPRRVTPEEIRNIAVDVPGHIPRVGVFVNAGTQEIDHAVSVAGLGALQLHGDESPQVCEEVRDRFRLPVIKALRLKRPQDKEDLDPSEVVALYKTADIILIEPYVRGQYGGTGKTADWSLAAEILTEFPGQWFFLAGGLNPNNIREALTQVSPHGVDASSGLEAARGIKDHQKIRLFSEVVKANDRT